MTRIQAELLEKLKIAILVQDSYSCDSAPRPGFEYKLWEVREEEKLVFLISEVNTVTAKNSLCASRRMICIGPLGRCELLSAKKGQKRHGYNACISGRP